MSMRGSGLAFGAVAFVLIVGTACVGGGNDIQSEIQKVGGVPLTTGTAHVEITGAKDLAFDAPLEKGQVGTAVTVFLYRSSDDDVFSITGLGIGDTGTATTSTNLALTITSSEVSADSLTGECTIKVAHEEANSVSGTAVCTNLDSNEGTIGVNASFSAAP
ncbi:MAG TPA: hypothetical protein VNN79_10840 [Actinomycetota bacterium]|nr:hypothetical protein [Actinomycetota bacterium]